MDLPTASDILGSTKASDRHLSDLTAQYHRVLETAIDEKMAEQAKIWGFSRSDAEDLHENFQREVKANPLYSRSQLATSNPYEPNLTKSRFIRIVTWANRGPIEASIIKQTDPPVNIGDFTIWTLSAKVTVKKLLQSVKNPFLLLASKVTSRQLQARSNHKTRTSRRKRPANCPIRRENVAPGPPITPFFVHNSPQSPHLPDQEIGEAMVTMLNNGSSYVELVSTYRDTPRILLYLAQNAAMLRELEKVLQSLN